MSGIVVVHAPPIREDRYDDLLGQLRADASNALCLEAADIIESFKLMEDARLSESNSPLMFTKRGEGSK